MEEKENVDIDQFFYDKRDSSFFRLTSTHGFFEIFSKKKHKCDQLIPETIIFYSGFLRKFINFNHFLKVCQNYGCLTLQKQMETLY